MTDTSPPITEKPKWAWLRQFSGTLVAVAAVGTLIFAIWNQSIGSAKEQGRLEAELSTKNDLIAQYKEAITATQKQLRETQTALQDSKSEFSRATSDQQKASRQSADMEKIIEELQAQNARLNEALQVADSCRPIQKRIAEIETKIELSGTLGGYAPHQLVGAHQQLADHQASLRTCLSATR